VTGHDRQSRPMSIATVAGGHSRLFGACERDDGKKVMVTYDVHTNTSV
jgi:hypothetical protein